MLADEFSVYRLDIKAVLQTARLRFVFKTLYVSAFVEFDSMGFELVFDLVGLGVLSVAAQER